MEIIYKTNTGKSYRRDSSHVPRTGEFVIIDNIEYSISNVTYSHILDDDYLELDKVIIKLIMEERR